MSPGRTTQYRDIGDPMAREAHGDSSTESREALIGKEDDASWSEDQRSELGVGRASRSQRIWSRLSTFRWLLDVLLVLAVVGLVVDRSYHNKEDKFGQFEGAGDLTGFAPSMSQQITTFVPDPAFIPENGSEFFTETVRKKWLSIVPKGLGYVKIPDPQNYNNLPTPLESYPPSTFTTSMTHQLHCLHAIVATVAGMTSNNTEKAPSEGAWHLSHCFEYLRQSIMCCGDMALEGQQTTFPAGFTGSDGWDAKHVCKDYKQVITHLEKQRANDMVWI